jgi:pimeloyl-ACP methyl ester carboxylesterase
MAAEKGKSVTDWENATDSSTPTVFYRTLDVEGLEMFYREAGPRDAPTVLLLHGFPSSSHMFRNLIPLLVDKYHVVAPDFPGYGESSAPVVQALLAHAGRVRPLEAPGPGPPAGVAIG